jgi:CBS domain-containing protein
MKVRDIAVAGPVLTVREGDDLALANQMMLWAGVKHLPVVREGAVVGVLSASDVLRAAGASSREAARRLVGATMSRPAQTIGPDDEAAVAAARMVERRIGSLPVVSDGALVGILTRTDLLALEALGGLESEIDADAGVSAAMHVDPVTVHEDDDLIDAAMRMHRRGLRHVPVIDGARRVVGVLGEQDVRAATGATWLRNGQSGDIRLLSLKVAHAMSAPAVTVPVTASLALAARAFMDHRVGALPVIDMDDHLVGMVSYLDMLAAAYKPMGQAATWP